MMQISRVFSNCALQYINLAAREAETGGRGLDTQPQKFDEGDRKETVLTRTGTSHRDLRAKMMSIRSKARPIFLYAICNSSSSTWCKVALPPMPVCRYICSKTILWSHLLGVSAIEVADRQFLHGSWLAAEHSCLAAQIAAVPTHPYVFSNDFPSHAQAVEMTSHFALKSGTFHLHSTAASFPRLDGDLSVPYAAAGSPVSATGNGCCLESAVKASAPEHQ